MLGAFLEISLSVRDVLDAVRFYEQLGFREALSGEVWTHPYAVLGDGRLYLGLHRYEFPSPSLTFVLPELKRRLADLEAAGVGFEFCKVSDDEFHEAGFFAPDAQMVTLLEARTYSPLPVAGREGSLCGYFSEYRLAVRDRAAAQRRWEALGFVATQTGEAPPRSVVSTRGLNIALWQSAEPAHPALVFVNERLEECAARLRERGCGVERMRDADGEEALVLAAPQGPRLIIRRAECA